MSNQVDYKILQSGCILKLSTGGVIPIDLGNSDYQTYLQWVEDGGTALPSDTPAVVIPSISPRQIRMALTRVNLRAYVEAAVASGDTDLKDWWEFSTSFERLNPQVIAMGTALGQTAEELDALWLLGSTL